MTDANTDNMIENNKEIFYCKICDFTCSKQSNYDIHIKTRKHLKLENTYINTDANTDANKEITIEKCKKVVGEYRCDCGKLYKHRQSLYTHKKKCKKEKVIQIEENIILEDPVEIDNKEQDMKDKQIKFYEKIIKENEKIIKKQDMVIEQATNALEAVTQGIGGNNNNINSNNTTNNTNNFNLNVFLNEDCKHALNLMDFVNSLKLQLTDLERSGRLGYSKGIAEIFIDGLEKLDITERPIHCTDTKRDVLYIKENDQWEKEDDNKEHMKKAIEHIGRENSKQVIDWVNENPGSMNPKSSKNDTYSKIIENTMHNAEDKDIKKIIKEVAKKVPIK